VQEQPTRKPQSIDGFVRNRERRSVVYSRSHAPIQSSTLGVRRHQGESHRPLGDLVPRTGPMMGDQHSSQATSLPVKQASPTFRSRRQVNTDKPKTKRWKGITKRGALIVLALFVICAGWLGWKVYRNTAKVFGNNNPLHVLSAFKPVPLKGQDQGRVNILLAGNSSDAAAHGGASLIDSIMLVSVNTRENTAFMLSIPRDLWVDVPGMGYGKINTTGAAETFNENGYPKGGIGALQKTLSTTLGIDIHYYSLVNYTAFKDAVNSVGGIDVNIQSADKRGLYDPSFRPHEGGALKLPNGQNHLGGQVALNLARARGDPYNGVAGAYGFPQSDFDRTNHQRMMMLALKDKAISMQVLSNPGKVGKLMDSVGNNVKTDFQLNELTSLYHLMKQVKTSNIQSLSLNNADGSNLLMNYTAPGGQSALSPALGPEDFSAIKAYIAKVMNANKATKEGAKIVVLNGGEVVGLAKEEGDYLGKKGLTVTHVGDAPAKADTTKVVEAVSGKMPETKKMLQKIYGNTLATDAALAQQFGADYVIVLGANQQSRAQTGTEQ
jgi:LCP family protein required for cell wall assembly